MAVVDRAVVPHVSLLLLDGSATHASAATLSSPGDSTHARLETQY